MNPLYEGNVGSGDCSGSVSKYIFSGSLLEDRTFKSNRKNKYKLVITEK